MQSWVWWLLPWLVARALMPVGFMAQVHQGRLQVVLCAAGLPQTLSLPTAQQQPASHDVGADHHCPFSQVIAPPVVRASGSAVIDYVYIHAPSGYAALPYYAVGPPRLDLARGPPHA